MERQALAVIGALAIGLTAWTSAGSDPGKKGKGGRRHERALLEKMGLSEDQASQLRSSFEAERKTIRPLRRELRDAFMKLRDQVEDLALDKDIQATLDRVESARKALRGERERFRQSISEKLTPTQRAKQMLSMGKMTAMGHHTGRGGWGGMSGEGMGTIRGRGGWHAEEEGKGEWRHAVGEQLEKTVIEIEEDEEEDD